MLNTQAHLGKTQALIGPAVMLRLEGLAILATALALYAERGASWAVFAALLLGLQAPGSPRHAHEKGACPGCCRAGRAARAIAPG